MIRNIRFAYRFFGILIMMLCVSPWGRAQSYQLDSSRKFQKVRFDMINNLMVIPVTVNGTELSFILDSGVNKPILFNMADQDSIPLHEVSEVIIKGLGADGPIRALRSKENHFTLGKVQNPGQELYVIMDPNLNFSTSLGIPIHGIIGYDLFRDFVVEINYGNQYIKLHDPEKYKHKRKKYSNLPLDIHMKKAFVTGDIAMNGRQIPVRLLVDTGSSDALWLFTDEEKGIELPQKHYEDFLGHGLNGSVFGKRTKVEAVQFADFELEGAKAAFPNEEAFSALRNLGERDGSVGGDVLKRFNLVFNYQQGELSFKPNRYFSDPFEYNLSGVNLQHNGVRYIAEHIASNAKGFSMAEEQQFGDVQLLFEQRTRISLVPEIVVSAIRAGSPAHEAGLREGDLILAVDGKRIHKYKLQEISKMLNERVGKRVKVLIERSDQDLQFTFTLKKIFQPQPKP